MPSRIRAPGGEPEGRPRPPQSPEPGRSTARSRRENAGKGPAIFPPQLLQKGTGAARIGLEDKGRRLPISQRVRVGGLPGLQPRAAAPALRGVRTQGTRDKPGRRCSACRQFQEVTTVDARWEISVRQTWLDPLVSHASNELTKPAERRVSSAPYPLGHQVHRSS